jgi:hypothetical protein
VPGRRARSRQIALQFICARLAKRGEAVVATFAANEEVLHTDVIDDEAAQFRGANACVHKQRDGSTQDGRAGGHEPRDFVVLERHDERSHGLRQCHDREGV